MSYLPEDEVDLIAVEIAMRDVLRPFKFASIAFKVIVSISTFDSLTTVVVDVSSSTLRGNENFLMSSSVVSTVPFFLISVCTSLIVVCIKVWMTVVKKVF